jgi:pyruvate formate lyase activating enzyme
MVKSIELLKAGKVPYEFRTTVVPEIVTAKDIPAIGELVKGSKIHALQQFTPDDTLDKRFQTLRPYPPETIAEFAKILRQYTEKVVFRV